MKSCEDPPKMQNSEEMCQSGLCKGLGGARLLTLSLSQPLHRALRHHSSQEVSRLIHSLLHLLNYSFDRYLLSEARFTTGLSSSSEVIHSYL